MSEHNGASPPENGTTSIAEEQPSSDGRWQPGQSGNPAGRPPKVKSLTAALEGITDKDELAQRMVDIAMGKLTTNVAIQLEAAKYIYARIEGNPVQALRHSTDGTMQPMIFLHPGRDSTGGEADSSAISQSDAPDAP